ncbi:CD225/dispanin family protein [Siphonobacter sp. SORGH_AS_0500]|uniref:CD225/dispanin family protein n=1 Tax=Siphonobacter sp. SORGH_AS_0500 TaxID=1864824 RepID=UPI00285A21CD|nr:CD225/dispanin family protein [Siphonobacter sp. SORGH_AS_0500]MDR6194480.1 hypothetical protein [Siphonobacter sp. SORGH_AS_0500]
MSTVPPFPTDSSFNTPPKPYNWLVPAILVTLFCCNYLGVVGVVYAARVETKYNLGDYAGADSDARQAKLWTLVPLAVGVVLWLGLVIFYGALISSTLKSGGVPSTY